MPYQFKKPCAYPGCPNLTNEKYCEEHKEIGKQEHNATKHDPNHSKKYGNNWRRLRAAYAKAHPLCEECLKKGRLTPVEEVHHIVPLNRGGKNEWDNLMSLCQSCHTKIHYQMGDRKKLR